MGATGSAQLGKVPSTRERCPGLCGTARSKARRSALFGFLLLILLAIGRVRREPQPKRQRMWVDPLGSERRGSALPRGRRRRWVGPILVTIALAAGLLSMQQYFAASRRPSRPKGAGAAELYVDRPSVRAELHVTLVRSSNHIIAQN